MCTSERGSSALRACVRALLAASNAEDIVEIDLRGASTIGDCMVVCSGRSARHVASIAENLVVGLKSEAGLHSRIEGRELSDWVLIDAGDVIVHVFRPEVRAFYQLEKMWQPVAAPTDKATG